MDKSGRILEVRGLKKHFPLGGGFLSGPTEYLKAVDGVDLEITKGEIFGLVGESGCGKTTLGRCIIRLENPTEGQIIFKGQNIFELPPKEMRRIRKDLQIVFQDPYSSLNPRKKVGRIICDAFKIHGPFDRHQQQEKLAELMNMVGLRSGQADRYPHEFSGGQRQRISLARALATGPELIVADEPVSALDVSIQAQIINLMVDLQERLGLTYIFISHDLSVVRHLCDRAAVMYLGRIVEQAPKAELFEHPLHPYTRALLSAVPEPKITGQGNRLKLRGEVTSQMMQTPGCPFEPRCLESEDVCRVQKPLLKELFPGHWAACHKAEGFA